VTKPKSVHLQVGEKTEDGWNTLCGLSGVADDRVTDEALECECKTCLAAGEREGKDTPAFVAADPPKENPEPWNDLIPAETEMVSVAAEVPDVGELMVLVKYRLQTLNSMKKDYPNRVVGILKPVLGFLVTGIKNFFDGGQQQPLPGLNKGDPMERFWLDLADASGVIVGPDADKGPVDALASLGEGAKKCSDMDVNGAHDLREFASMVVLAFDATRRAGFTYRDLLAELTARLEKKDLPLVGPEVESK
jgi:hypothetical protein